MEFGETCDHVDIIFLPHTFATRDSPARTTVCMSRSPGQIAGSSGCFDVLPHSKPPDQSLSTEEAESSGRTSPVLTDPVVFSPQPQHNNRRSE